MPGKEFNFNSGCHRTAQIREDYDQPNHWQIEKQKRADLKTMTWVEPNWFHYAELLGRIGRKPLASTLDMLAPFLARQNLSLPDSSLPDARYFAELAVIFRSQPIKIAVYLPPFLAPGSQAHPRKPTPTGATAPPPSDQPQNSLSAARFLTGVEDE